MIVVIAGIVGIVEIVGEVVVIECFAVGFVAGFVVVHAVFVVVIAGVVVAVEGVECRVLLGVESVGS